MEQILKEILCKLDIQDKEIAKINKNFADFQNAQYFPNWIPRSYLMSFLDYGDTQIATLLKDPTLKVSEVGIRKFVDRESIMIYLEKNVKSPKKASSTSPNLKPL